MSADGSSESISWIDRFLEGTKHLPSPRIYRLWAGISAVSGALERRVWSSIYELQLFANTYIVLVGPPGGGKSLAVKEVEALWRELPDTHVAPTSVSKASLADALFEAKRQIIRLQDTPPTTVEYNALLICASELGLFMPNYESEFIMAMIAFYDGDYYDERKRTGTIKVKIPRPHLQLLSATTPQFLGKYFAEGTWDQGFNSRTIYAYSGESFATDPFAKREILGDRESLLDGLKKIVETMYGEMTWSREAKIAHQAWLVADEPPKPTHTRLQYYLTRRKTHIIKLAMIAAASRFSMTITQDDYATAMGWLLEVEEHMPDIFKAMTVGSDAIAMDDAFGFLFTEYMKGGGKTPVMEHRIVNFLKERLPAHSVMRSIEIMLKSRMMEEIWVEGKRGFKPIAKQEHKHHS